MVCFRRMKFVAYPKCPFCRVSLEEQEAIINPKDCEEGETRWLNIGDKLMARDNLGKWYESEVVQTSGNYLKIHFIGWESRHDEWFPIDSPKIDV